MAGYPLMEHFYTLQGEGYYAGRAAYFIRLAGCDVGCVWCDVKESWHTDGYPVVAAAEMTNYVVKHKSPIAVITGGEPAMYDLTELCERLRQCGIRVHIETSGSHPIIGDFDWVTLSPKKFKAPRSESLEKADELKVVGYNQSDFAWAELHASQVRSSCKLYLQPEWSKREKINPLLVEYIRQNPQWQLSLQTHKYINIL